MAILFISPKEAYFTKRLLAEAAKANITVNNVDIQELADKNFKVDISQYDCLYIRYCYPYFQQTIELAKHFADAGKKVVDAAIAQGDVGLGKWPLCEKLAAAHIPMPKTSWFTESSNWQYPCIVKWAYGFGGKEVFLVRDVDQLYKATELIPQEELLLQEFIPAEFEYKVITVGYKALPVVLRFGIDKKTWRPDFGNYTVIGTNTTPPLGFARGTPPTLGGESAAILKNSPSNIGRVRHEVTGGGIKELIALAEQSSRILNRELAKVDILEAQGKFYVLEVNRWPGLKSFEQLTGYNAAGEFVKYLAK